MNPRVLQEVVRSYSYVLTWMGISSSVILFNKWLLAFSGFPYPIALTLWHMVFCSTVGVLCVRVFRVVKSHNMSTRDYCRRVMPIGETAGPWSVAVALLCSGQQERLASACQPSRLPNKGLSGSILEILSHLQQVWDLPRWPQQALQPPCVVCAGFLYAASLWLSNSSYLYLSVSFIQMTKSLMPGLVYCCGIAFGVERFTTATAANMLLIAFGVAVCAFGEVNLVVKGVVQQLSALLFEVSPCPLSVYAFLLE